MDTSICVLCGGKRRKTKHPGICQNIHIVNCGHCGKDFEYRKKWKGLKEKYSCPDPVCKSAVANYLSKKTKLEKYGDPNFNNIAQTRKTNLERYGGECSLQSESVKEKIRQTNLERYGNTSATRNKEVKEKAKQTSLERYGATSSLGNKEIREKAKNTMIERYGAEYAMQSEQLRAKIDDTNIQKYGNVFPTKSDEVKNRIISTNIKKYGGNSPQSSPEIREKTKQTFINKYNVDNPAKSEVIIEKIKKTNNERYGVDWALCDEGVKAKIRQTILKRYDVDHPSQSEEIKDKKMITMLNKGSMYVSNENFILVLKSWKSEVGRKPTLKELADYWGYATVSPVGQRVTKLNLSHLVNKKDSFLELKIKDFLDEFGINYKRRDKTEIKPLELDFWLPDYNVAIEVNDFLTHNSTYDPWGEPKPKDYHINKTKLCRDKNIRLIHAWEDQILDDEKFKVLKNAILHACGKSTHKVYARNTRIEVRPAIEMKDFFNENNIAGYRGAKDVYVLVCKKTNEDLMAYSVGHARFGKGKYDAEIIRGACKLGYTVVGGASKLWKHIIKNTNYNSIVYYVDLNTYAGESMNFLENVEFISEQPGLKNYWVKEKRLKNREPARHKEIVELTKQGKVWAIWDAGVQVNVWQRK